MGFCDKNNLEYNQVHNKVVINFEGETITVTQDGDMRVRNSIISRNEKQ